MPSAAFAPQIAPASIAAGIGLADRREICGLLALLAASGVGRMLEGLATAAREKLRPSETPEVDQVAQMSQNLFSGSRSTDALRCQLWFEIAQPLGLPDPLPLSMRKIREDAAAMGVRAAEALKPAVIAARRAAAEGAETETGLAGVGRKLWRAMPKIRSAPSEAVDFPDVVAHELTALMEKLAKADPDGALDPEVAAAIRKGQAAISAAAVAGGGWIAFAASVGAAGFAPYIAAAKLSAIIPFVSGPALVSFLAVMINPVTVAAGTAALGYWAVKGPSAAARQVAAARAAVLLAVTGMQDPDAGIAALATAFRRSGRAPRKEMSHLNRREYGALVERAQRLEKRLQGEAPPAVAAAPGVWGRPIRSGAGQGSTDAALIGGLTAGDMLYHAAAIDPAVLAAADFSRRLAIEDPLDLAAHIASFSASGAQIGLRGYTAEQVVMARLVEQGHVVELAAGSTTPGYDLIVDGAPVQVKCGASLSLLQEHFSKYPEIPVIADVGLAEMADKAGAPWAHLVATVDGFDLEHVQNIVDRSLDAAQSLGEGAVPVYAMIVGGARAASKAWKGEIPVEDLPAWLVLDLSIRGGLAAAGQIGGGFIGLLAIGPAGALVLGPAAGIAALFGTGALHGAFDRAIRSEWRSDVIAAAEELRSALTRVYDRRLDLLLARRSGRRERANLPGDLGGWLEGRQIEDVISVWEKRDALKPISTLHEAMELLIEASASGLAAWEVLRLRERLASLIETKPSTTASLARLGEELGGAMQERLRKPPTP